MKLLIGMLTITLSSICLADEKSHREAAAKLLQASNAESVLTAAYGKIEQAIANQILQLKPSPDSKPIIDKYTVKMKSAMREEINWVKMQPPLIDAYVQTYSEKTIKQITRFYQSKAGQEMLENQPKMVNATMGIMQNMTKGFIPKLQSIQTDMAKELQKMKKEKQAKSSGG